MVKIRYSFMLSNPKLVSKPFGQLLRVSVRQDPKIRIQSALRGGFADRATSVGCNALCHFSKHPLFRACPHCDVVRQDYVSEEIRALSIFSDGYFFRVQLQFQLLSKKILYGWQQTLQVRFITRNDNKIIGVAGVPSYSQRVFYKVIKLAHVDIRKHLRGEVADRDALALGCRVALYNFCQKPKRFSISDSSLKNAEQNGMINGIEKLSHVTLKYPAFIGSVLALGPKHISHAFDAFMRAFADAAGKRGRDECLLKNRIDYSKNRVMQNAVSHYCFVYSTALRIVNPKSVVWAVLVGLIPQVATQLKDMLLNLLLKFGNVRLISFVAFENFPCRKEVLCGNY
jgi:hypothetical protein